MDNLKMILQRAGTFLTAIFLALTTLSVGNNLIIKKDDGVRLSAALVSDVHYGDAFYRQLSLPPGLRDISRHVKPDLFVPAGDCTDNGNDENWSALQKAIDKNLKVDNIILALGNHDTWTSYDDGHYYDEAKGNFLRYSNAIVGEGELPMGVGVGMCKGYCGAVARVGYGVVGEVAEDAMGERRVGASHKRGGQLVVEMHPMFFQLQCRSVENLLHYL